MLQIARDMETDNQGAVYVVGENLVRTKDKSGWGPADGTSEFLVIEPDDSVVKGMELEPGAGPIDVKLTRGLTKNGLLDKMKRMNAIKDIVARWNPNGKFEVKPRILNDFYKDCSDEHLPMDELMYINGMIKGVLIGVGDHCHGHNWGRGDKCIFCGKVPKGGAWK